MTNQQRAIDALKKIEDILNDVRDLYPEVKKVKVSETKFLNAFAVLKRVNGIIVNYNEENAERKLKSLMAFLGTTGKK